ncbi:hypothetical protein WN66_06681 [Saccharomyces cerevisiae]|nr:hypothetical protein WN66_06681 [Saccharomyces cerevisiae]
MLARVAESVSCGLMGQVKTGLLLFDGSGFSDRFGVMRFYVWSSRIYVLVLVVQAQLILDAHNGVLFLLLFFLHNFFLLPQLFQFLLSGCLIFLNDVYFNLMV